ncbi:MAG TPA: putative sulfate exporter family transporter [Nocardioides sp.]
MPPVALEARTRPRLLPLPLLVAAAAMALHLVVPALSAVLVALALGAVVANSGLVTGDRLAREADTARRMLRTGVVALGLRLPFQELVSIGVPGLVVVVTTVLVTYQLTRWIGIRLGLDDGVVSLVAAGFSICGAAAIAAMSDVLRSRQRDAALAVAMVTVFGGAMIVVVPWSSRLLELSDLQAAVWSGASIHEVAQVAAAASAIGSGAVALAMLIKLGRVAMLAPVCWFAGRAVSGTRTGPVVPWFIIGFVAMAGLRSATTLTPAAMDAAEALTTLLLAGGMVGLGLGLRLRDLWPIPVRLLLLAGLSTCAAVGWSLGLVAILY